MTQKTKLEFICWALALISIAILLATAITSESAFNTAIYMVIDVFALVAIIIIAIIIAQHVRKPGKQAYDAVIILSAIALLFRIYQPLFAIPANIWDSCKELIGLQYLAIFFIAILGLLVIVAQAIENHNLKNNLKNGLVGDKS